MRVLVLFRNTMSQTEPVLTIMQLEFWQWINRLSAVSNWAPDLTQPWKLFVYTVYLPSFKHMVAVLKTCNFSICQFLLAKSESSWPISNIGKIKVNVLLIWQMEGKKLWRHQGQNLFKLQCVTVSSCFDPSRRGGSEPLLWLSDCFLLDQIKATAGFRLKAQRNQILQSSQAWLRVVTTLLWHHKVIGSPDDWF